MGSSSSSNVSNENKSLYAYNLIPSSKRKEYLSLSSTHPPPLTPHPLTPHPLTHHLGTSREIPVYISTEKSRIYHTEKGHYNARIPVYNIKDRVNMLKCTQCNRPKVVIDPSKTITVTTPFYISTEKGKVYHTRKGHYCADIPIYKITNNMVGCTRGNCNPSQVCDTNRNRNPVPIGWACDSRSPVYHTVRGHYGAKVQVNLSAGHTYKRCWKC
jgi:hypothetical protein